MSGLIEGGTNDDSPDSATVLRGLLEFNGGRFSVEVQKLCFFADVYAVEKYRSRLTSLEYRAYMYGPYSEEISERLDELASDGRVETRTAMRDGKTDTKYNVENRVTDLTDEQRQVLGTTVAGLEECDPVTLTDLSRKNWMYKKTDSGDPLSFKRYVEALEDGGAEPQMLAEVTSEHWVEEGEDGPDGLSPV